MVEQKTINGRRSIARDNQHHSELYAGTLISHVFESPLDCIMMEPMELRVVSKRKITTTKYSVLSCNADVKSPASVVLRVDGDPQYNVRYVIPKRCALWLLGRFSDPKYFYRVKWRLGRVRHSLKVNRLSVISELIKFNATFDVLHKPFKIR